jgi:hypothetical protein
MAVRRPVAEPLSIDNVRCEIKPCDPATGRVLPGIQRHSGQLHVTGFGLSFTWSTWLSHRSIEVYRDELVGLIDSQQPLLFGQPWLTLSTHDQTFKFRMASFDDARTAHLLLTTPMR